MEKIRTVIIDDEPFAREGLKTLLRKDEEFEVIGEAENGRDAVETITKLNPDLIFLDIQMPGMDGFEVIEEIPLSQLPVIVFVTAYDQYALKAFDANAVDYLLKPFDDDRFYQTINKVKIHIRMKEDITAHERVITMLDQITKNKSAKTKNREYPKRISVKDKNETKIISVNDIDYVTSADYYITVHTKSGSYTIRESMKNMEDKLNPDDFIRIHRNTIININNISAIQLFGKNSYIVKTYRGDKFDISRSRLNELRSKLGM